MLRFLLLGPEATGMSAVEFVNSRSVDEYMNGIILTVLSQFGIEKIKHIHSLPL